MKITKSSLAVGAPKYLSDIINLYGNLTIANFMVKTECNAVPWFELEGPFHPIESEELTVQEILDTMTDAQRKVLHYLIGKACKETNKRGDDMLTNDWLYDKYSGIPTDNSRLDIFQKYTTNVTATPSQQCCSTSAKSNTTDISKGEEKMDLFNGMFGKVANGMCRLSMYGGIAVKTSNGYKTYNLKKKRLTNCSNFVFDVGQEFFFVIPTNKVEPGDIILIAGKPKCVISVNNEMITVINYEDSVVEQILPERHVFMGNTYFYGKIVSMFGNDILGNGKKGMNKLMSYMMMSEMMKGMNGSGNQNAMNSMLPFLMMSGGNMNGLFGDIFNLEEEDEENSDETPEIEDGAKTE